MGTTNYRNGKKPAKTAGANVGGKSRSDCRWFVPVLVELRRLFPQKLAAELAVMTNRHQRVCEKWIAGDGTPDGEALCALLNSRVGDRVWLALTKASAEPWRKKLNRQIEISHLRDVQRDAAARLAALEGDL